MNNKKCKKCDLAKSVDDFHKDKSRKDGLLDWCKKCKIQSRMEWHKKNLDRDKITRERYADNHPNKGIEVQKQYRLDNPGYYAQKAKEYRARLGDKYNERIRKQDKEKRKNDPFYAMKRRISGTLYTSIVKRGFKKKSRSYELLCCNYEEFKLYIESQFDSSMSWDNHGTMWTYDHICPCAQAQNEEELIKLQHHTNWRPYKDNFQKSDSRTAEGKLSVKNYWGENGCESALYW